MKVVILSWGNSNTDWHTIVSFSVEFIHTHSVLLKTVELLGSGLVMICPGLHQRSILIIQNPILEHTICLLMCVYSYMYDCTSHFLVGRPEGWQEGVAGGGSRRVAGGGSRRE